MARLQVDIVGCEVRYVCEDLDAGLPLHAHEPGSDMNHTTRCDEGAIVLFVYPDERHELHAGDAIIFDSSRWHGIYPLTVGARFTNTARGPQPDFHSVLEQGHNAPAWAKEAP